MEKEPITLQGLEKLKKELEELKNIKRPKIVAAIAEARGQVSSYLQTNIKFVEMTTG